MQSLKRFVRANRQALRWRLRVEPTRWTNPDAYRFFAALMSKGFQPDALIDVVPQYRLIYVGVPKAASSTIKKSLSRLAGAKANTLQDVHTRHASGLLGPSDMGASRFFEIATAPDTLRFSFVRNPYDRPVSCWADKFRGRPLVSGDPFVNVYLAYRKQADRSLPYGKAETLPFSIFVEMALATCLMRIDPHWSLQDDIINVPGMKLDMIGKTENFAADYRRVLAHVAAVAGKSVPDVNSTNYMNMSERSYCRDYFDDALAKRVRRAFERDFDRFGYPDALPD